MGCDTFWKATQSNIKKQKQASLFVHAIVDVLDGKIISLPCSDIEVYNGSYSGYFLNYDTLFPKMIVNTGEEENNSIASHISYEPDLENYKPEYLNKKKKLNLIGFNAYFGGKPTAEEDAASDFPDYVAEFQLSFVFNNSLNNRGESLNELITIEKISDLRWRRYKRILENFKDTPKNPKRGKYAVYKSGGYVRDCSHPLLLIFYIVKQLYIPNLKVIDDYNEFSEFEKRMKKNGFEMELADKDKRWNAVAQMTGEILGFKFYKQNIRSDILKTWGVTID